jgi:hypothetical protein
MKLYFCLLCCAILPLVCQAQIVATGPIDGATRAEVIDGVSQQLLKHYISLDQAQAMVAAIRERQKKREYDSFNDGLAFAARLNTDLQAVSHDKHVEVSYSLPPIPLPAAVNMFDADAKSRATSGGKPAKPLNWPACKPGIPQRFAFGSAECLPGNIGLLKLADRVPPPEEAMPYLAAAMTSLAGTRALIIDLREGYGGESNSIVMLESYLFDHSVPVDDFYIRETDKTLHNATSEKVDGKKYGQKKTVYVLTGRLTFSADEMLAYDLQAYKRATLVGENTLGGAHGVAVLRLNEHFALRVPNADTTNPVTKGNWEGTGVKPDVAVPETDALNVAQVLLLRKVMQTERNASSLTQLRQRVQELQGRIVDPVAVAAAR